MEFRMSFKNILINNNATITNNLLLRESKPWVKPLKSTCSPSDILGKIVN